MRSAIRKRLGLLVLAPLMATLLAGCWDRREINERSNVLGTGVDLCRQEQGATCRTLVSRQIAIPGRIPLGGGSPTGGGGGGGGENNTVVVLTTPGKDGVDSAARAQSELNREISFGHTRLVVFSEAYARQSLEEYLDYVRRIAEARRLMWIAISEGTAEAVMRARPSLEQVPALFLNDMLDEAVRNGRLPEIFLGEFLTRVSNRGEEAVAPLIRMVGQDHPKLTGLAVFRRYQMVGKLNPEETATFMELRGLRKGAEILMVPLPGGHIAGLSVYGRGAKYHVTWAGDHLQVRVRMSLETELRLLSPELKSSDPQVLKQVQVGAAELVQQRGGALLQKLQHDFRADVLGLGERVRAFYPGIWRNIPEWQKAYEAAEFQLEAKVYIRRTGMSMD